MSSSNKESNGFKIKDPISFSFSLVAIILTLFNIYLAHFRTTIDVTVRTVKSNIKKDSTGQDVFYITFAFINSGNSEAIVSDVRYYLSKKQAFDAKPKYDGDFGNHDDEIPFSLGPRKTKLVTLYITSSALDEYQRDIGIKHEGAKQEISYCAYRFRGIDANGKEQQRSTESDFMLTRQDDGKLKAEFLDKEVEHAKVYQIFWR